MRRRTQVRRVPAHIALVEREGSGERTFSYRRGQEKHLRDYDVLREGVVIGHVYQDLATFERRTPGRMYVNARWSNVRWFFDHKEKIGDVVFDRRSTDYRTRVDAIEGLEWALALEAKFLREETESAASQAPQQQTIQESC